MFFFAPAWAVVMTLLLRYGGFVVTTAQSVEQQRFCFHKADAKTRHDESIHMAWPTYL